MNYVHQMDYSHHLLILDYIVIFVFVVLNEQVNFGLYTPVLQSREFDY
jgi:hypothetical protein